MVSTAGGIILAIVILAIVGAIGWAIFTILRARRLGLPPPSWASWIPFANSNSSYPSPRPGGIVGWVSDRVRSLKNRNSRVATGAYESSTGIPSSSNRRGFGPLDPDEAWDARVGQEADGYGPPQYYEEQELGPAGGQTAYHGSSYAMNIPGTPNPPKPASSPAPPPAPVPAASISRAPVPKNPFDDDAEPSNVSLHSGDQTYAQPPKRSRDSDPDNSTDRRSIFRENV